MEGSSGGVDYFLTQGISALGTAVAVVKAMMLKTLFPRNESESGFELRCTPTLTASDSPVDVFFS